MGAREHGWLILVGGLVGLLVAGLVTVAGWPSDAPVAIGIGIALGVWLGGVLTDRWLLPDDDDEAETRSLYVGNLPFDAREGEIRAIFEQVGTVHRVRIIRDFKTKRSKGYAFIDMDAAGAERALAELSGATLRGRRLKLGRAARETR